MFNSFQLLGTRISVADNTLTSLKGTKTPHDVACLEYKVLPLSLNTTYATKHNLFDSVIHVAVDRIMYHSVYCTITNINGDSRST